MIEDDIDEALHALEFGPTVPDGQAKVSRARNALNALRVQAREADMLRAKCADIEAHHISNLADQVRVLKAEVERLRQKAGLAEETQAIMADLLAVSRKNANVDEHDQMVEDAAEELLRRYEEANRDV